MLGRVLASETFRRSERARALLSYLIGRAQAGEADRLKGYSIAVDVFGKDKEFDASTDAVVRVQASRLRELLSHYYETEGSADPVRIVIPRGSYVPSYQTVEPHASPGEAVEDNAEPVPHVEATQDLPPSRLPRGVAGIGQVRLLWAAFALLAVLLGVIGYRTTFGEEPATGALQLTRAAGHRAPATAEVLSQALPAVHIRTAGEDVSVARLAAHLRTAFAGFDTVDMIGAGSLGPHTQPPYEPTGFLLTLTPGIEPGTVGLELQSLGSGKVLLTKTLSPAEITLQKTEDVVASIATSVAAVTGEIYDYLKQQGLQSRLVNCLVLSDAYYREPTPVRHSEAYKCLERLAAERPTSALVYSELSALHVEARTFEYGYPAVPTEEQAMLLARQAVQTGPASPYAHRAMGFYYSRNGNRDESIRWMRKAYELNTYDLSMAASYGYSLVFAGNYGDGAAILQRAIDASSAHPPWWDYSLFLAKFMLDDAEGAMRATDALVSAKRASYLGARLIAAHNDGDRQRVETLVREIASTYPKFAADPAAIFLEADYPPDLAVKFADALRSAGLGGQS